MTMTINQVLLAGLILAILIMAGAVAVLAVHAVRLMKNVDSLVDTGKEIAGEAGDAVKETVAKVGENATQVNKAATGIALALAVRSVIRRACTVRKAKKLLRKGKKGRK